MSFVWKSDDVSTFPMTYSVEITGISRVEVLGLVSIEESQEVVVVSGGDWLVEPEDEELLIKPATVANCSSSCRRRLRFSL